MSKNKFIALGLISFGLVLTGYMIAQAQTGEVKIERACSEGQFIRYTDCETGKAISRSALAPGKQSTPPKTNCFFKALHLSRTP